MPAWRLEERKRRLPSLLKRRTESGSGWLHSKLGSSCFEQLNASFAVLKITYPNRKRDELMNHRGTELSFRVSALCSLCECATSLMMFFFKYCLGLVCGLRFRDYFLLSSFLPFLISHFPVRKRGDMVHLSGSLRKRQSFVWHAKIKIKMTCWCLFFFFPICGRFCEYYWLLFLGSADRSAVRCVSAHSAVQALLWACCKFWGAFLFTTLKKKKE